MKRTTRLQIQEGADREYTGKCISSALPSASYGDLPSLPPGPRLTCWTARQPRHSPPSATPPVLPRRDSQGGGGRHDFVLVLHCHGAHVPVRRAATARDGQLREHLQCVGATCSRLLRPQPLYSCRHGALQSALPSSVPQEHALCLRYVPLLSNQATSCVSLWTLFLTSTQSLTCPFRLQMGFQTRASREFKTSFFEEKVDSVAVQTQFMEEKADPVLIAQQEFEQG